MFMPKSGGYHYLVATWDDLTHAAKGHALKRLTSKSVAKCLWEQIVCQYGHIVEIVIDNGSEFIGATMKLLK